MQYFQDCSILEVILLRYEVTFLRVNRSKMCINVPPNNRVRWCRQLPTVSSLAKSVIVIVLVNIFVQGLCWLSLALERSALNIAFFLIPRLAEWNVDLHVRVWIIYVLLFNKIIFSLTSVQIFDVVCTVHHLTVCI
jgi:hypothetical protein